LAFEAFDLLLEQRDDVAPVGTIREVVAAAIEAFERNMKQSRSPSSTASRGRRPTRLITKATAAEKAAAVRSRLNRGL
jgi:DNA invertase Pin-like site-specific DNA recombinase